MRLITPPLPAASRPSKMMAIRAPDFFTQAWRWASSTCSFSILLLYLRPDFSLADSEAATPSAGAETSPRLSSSPSRSLFLFFPLSLLMPFLQTDHQLSTAAKALVLDGTSRREPGPGCAEVVDLLVCSFPGRKRSFSTASSLQ